MGGKRGELAGIRTQDPRLKRALLYQLSYELAIQTALSKLPQGHRPIFFGPRHGNGGRESGQRPSENRRT
jgi:hypothetical protein